MNPKYSKCFFDVHPSIDCQLSFAVCFTKPPCTTCTAGPKTVPRGPQRIMVEETIVFKRELVIARAAKLWILFWVP